MLHNVCTIQWKIEIGCHCCSVLCHPRYVTVAVLAFHRVRDVQETLEILVKFTILAIQPSLTSSRGRYLMVVGIHSDG